MSFLNKKEVEKMQVQNHGIQSVPLNNGTVAWVGGELPENYYDNYTECLYANINAKRIRVHKEHGLNEQAQTKEQEKAFLDKRALQMKKKEKAEIAAEMAIQNA